MSKYEWIGLISGMAALIFLAAILAIAVEAPKIKHPMNDDWKE